jgi:predicted GNAT family N-acyltransferase
MHMITSIWAGPGGDTATAKALRKAVFEDELGLENTWDLTDDYAFHLVLLLDDVPVATGRISYGGVGVGKLSRICVAKKYRRQGIGDGLVKILDYKASELGMGHSQVDAAEELLPFYRRLGYQPCGEPFSQWGRQLTPMKKETNDGTRENCAHQCPGKKSQN